MAQSWTGRAFLVAKGRTASRPWSKQACGHRPRTERKAEEETDRLFPQDIGPQSLAA